MVFFCQGPVQARFPRYHCGLREFQKTEFSAVILSSACEPSGVPADSHSPQDPIRGRLDVIGSNRRTNDLTLETIIKPIKTDADYREALKEVESLMTAEFNTPEGEKLDVLVTLIEAYERKHFPLDLSEPVEAI
ncbi:hypothetical protein C8R28_104710 [Nitrosomonas ureae]|uniref:HTH-type transcriptional regulator / antitoxin HigA n=1 Tax=Nitrosomonas ureae TaxID=44577 RepID=A0A2T5I708_9PROT|nr:hypothetical protein C8R28_104710 [Nitrosomonas ureae]